jgi:hypothetical protein
MHKSTEEFFKMFMGGKEDLGKALEGYIYSRWPNLYIYHLRRLSADPEARYPEEVATPEADEMTRLVVERMLPTLFSTETSTYHGKVLTLDDARALVTFDKDI